MQGALLLPENSSCQLLQHKCVNRIPTARRQRAAPFCSAGTAITLRVARSVLDFSCWQVEHAASADLTQVLQVVTVAETSLSASNT